MRTGFQLSSLPRVRRVEPNLQLFSTADCPPPKGRARLQLSTLPPPPTPTTQDQLQLQDLKDQLQGLKDQRLDFKDEDLQETKYVPDHRSRT